MRVSPFVLICPAGAGLGVLFHVYVSHRYLQKVIIISCRRLSLIFINKGLIVSGPLQRFTDLTEDVECVSIFPDQFYFYVCDWFAVVHHWFLLVSPGLSTGALWLLLNEYNDGSALVKFCFGRITAIRRNGMKMVWIVKEEI